MNGPQLILRKVFHFNGFKSSNLKDNVDLESTEPEFHLSRRSEEFSSQKSANG